MTSRIDTIQAIPQTIDPSLQALDYYMALSYGSLNEASQTNYGRNRTFQQPHLEQSWDAILDAAEHATSRTPEGQPFRAAILGPGNLKDIPITDLTHWFDEVVLVDADKQSSRDALYYHPNVDLGKITLLATDITGTAGALFNSMSKAAKASDTFETFSERAIQIFDTTNAAESIPGLTGRFDFVCSHLLLSQLGAIPIAALNHDVVVQKFGAKLPTAINQDTSSLGQAEHGMEVRLHIAHLRQLAALVQQTGVVHFGDTQSHLVRRSIRGETEEIPMLDIDALTPVIDELFTDVAPLRKWNWDAAPGNVFVVMSRMLVPRLVAAQ